MIRSPVLGGDLRVDVCIVGGGYTGLWTALNIKELETAMDVAIIEKDICGGGASGRNGGFCMTWMSKISTLLKICGAQDGVRLLRESEIAVERIGVLCTGNDIDCQSRHDGWLWTSSNATQAGCWDETLKQLDRLGLHPFEPVPTSKLESMIGPTHYTDGVYERGVDTVQPALVARGLRKVALNRGVQI